MLSSIIGLFGVLVGLIGWFISKSYVLLFLGLAAHLIETFMEWKNLNAGAKTLDVVIFVIGCIIGLFLDTPFWVVGIVVLLIYSLLMSLVAVPMILSYFASKRRF